MKVLLVLCAAVLLSLLVAPALAQTTVSTIEGTIKDAQGSVVSGATVVVKSAALGIERTATSDAAGFYRVTALPAGIYSLTISHAGFATRTFEQCGADGESHPDSGYPSRGRSGCRDKLT